MDYPHGAKSEVSSDRKKLEELKRILSEERQTHKKTIGKLQKEFTKLRTHGALSSEERTGILKELERERMMRVGAERRMQGMQLESDSCRARLSALQDECRKMEEMVANMLQYKAKVDQLKQENASMKSSYEANLQKYCSHISSLERDNMVLRNQVKKMETQIHGKGDERDKSKLLLERLKMVEAENSSLVLENEQQRQQYEKCLDEIANQVVQALLAQKMLREECFKLQNRVQDLELQNKHLNMMFHQRMKTSTDPTFSDLPLDPSIPNGLPLGTGGGVNLDYIATAGSLHSMCSEIMGDDSPGKPQLSSPPPWLRDKMGLGVASSKLSGGSSNITTTTTTTTNSNSGNNTNNEIPSSSSPESMTSSSQSRGTPVDSSDQVIKRTKIETEFPATNASPKMKHVPVGDRRSRSLERGSSGPFAWMKKIGRVGMRSRRGSETHDRNDDDDGTVPKQRLKQSTSADALTHFGVGNKVKKSSSSSSTNKKLLSQSMDQSGWKDSLTPERLNAKGAKLLMRTTSADVVDTDKNKSSSGICDVNHQSFEAFNKSFEKLLAKNAGNDDDELDKAKANKTSSKDGVKQQTDTTTKSRKQKVSTATSTQLTDLSSTKDKDNINDSSTLEGGKVNTSTSTVVDTTSKQQQQQLQLKKQKQQKLQLLHQQQQQQQQQKQHLQLQQHKQHLQQQQQQKQQRSSVIKSQTSPSSQSQALRNPFAEPPVKSPTSAKSPSPLPGQYYYYDYSDEDSDSRPVSRDFSTASTMSLNEILDSSQEAEVALDDDFFSDWSSICISPQKRIDRLTGQTISNNALVSSKGRGASTSSSSSSSSKLSGSSSPDSPRHLHLYKAFINKQQQQLGVTKPDLLELQLKNTFLNRNTNTGKPEPIYDEPYIPETVSETETTISPPVVSKTISQKAVTRNLTESSPSSKSPNTTEVKAEIHMENFQRSANFQPSPSLSPNPSQISQDLGYASKESYSQSSTSPSPSISHRGTPLWLHSTKDPHSFSRNELLSLVINRDAIRDSPRSIPNSASPSSDSPKPPRPDHLILAPQDKHFNFQGGFSSVSSTSSEDKSPMKMFDSKHSVNKMESSVIEVKKDGSNRFVNPQTHLPQSSSTSDASISHSSSSVSLPTSPNNLKSPNSKIPPPVARKPIRAVKPEARSRTPSLSSGDNQQTPNSNKDESRYFPGAVNTNMTVGFVLDDNQHPLVIQNTHKSDNIIDNVVRKIMAKDTGKTQDSPSKHHNPTNHTSEFGSPSSNYTKICPSSDSSFENLRVERSGSKDDGYSTMSSDIHPGILEKFCDNTLTFKRSDTSEIHTIVNINNKSSSLTINNIGANHQRCLIERRNSDSVLQSRDRSFDTLISDQDSAMETSVHSTTDMVLSSSSQMSMSSTDLASPTSTLTNKLSKMSTYITTSPNHSPKKEMSRSNTDLTCNKKSNTINKVSKIARLFETTTTNSTGNPSTIKANLNHSPKQSPTKSPSSPRQFFSSNKYQQPESPRRLANEFQKNNTNSSNTNTAMKRNTTSPSPTNSKCSGDKKIPSLSMDKNEKSKSQQQQPQRKSHVVGENTSKQSTGSLKTSLTHKDNTNKVTHSNSKKDSKKSIPSTSGTKEKTGIYSRQSSLGKSTPNKKMSQSGNDEKEGNSKTINKKKKNIIKNNSIAKPKSPNVSTEFTLVLDPMSQNSNEEAVVLELVKGENGINQRKETNSILSNLANTSSKNSNCGASVDDITTDAEFSVVLDDKGVLNLYENKSSSQYETVIRNNTPCSCENKKNSTVCSSGRCCNNSNNRSNQSVSNIPNSTCAAYKSPSSCSTSSLQLPHHNDNSSTSCYLISSVSVSSNGNQNNNKSPVAKAATNDEPISNPNRNSLIMLTNQAFQQMSSGSDSDSSDNGGNSFPAYTLPPHYKPIPSLNEFNHPSSQSSSSVSPSSSSQPSSSDLCNSVTDNNQAISTNPSAIAISNNDHRGSSCQQYFSFERTQELSSLPKSSSTVDNDNDIPYLRRSHSDHNIGNGSSSKSTSMLEDQDGSSRTTCIGGMPLQRSASASQLDSMHRKYWGNTQQQNQGNYNNETISQSDETLYSANNQRTITHHNSLSSSSSSSSSLLSPSSSSSSTHRFQRFHGYQNVYSGHHRQQQHRNRLENYPLLAQSLRLDLSDVTELDEDGSELASLKDSLETSSGGVTSDESPRESNTDPNQFNSQFYSLCQFGSNKSLLSSSFDSKDKLSLSMNSFSNDNTGPGNNRYSCNNNNNSNNNSEEDEIALQEFDVISKQIASLSKTVDELNHSLSSLNSGEFEPNQKQQTHYGQAPSSSSSSWPAGSSRTDVDGYHWADDEFYLASSSNEKIVVVSGGAGNVGQHGNHNDYVDYATTSIFSQGQPYNKVRDAPNVNGRGNGNRFCSSGYGEEEEKEEEEEEVEGAFQDCISSSSEDHDDRIKAHTNFDTVIYRNKQQNRLSKQKPLVRWMSEGNLNCLHFPEADKRLSMPLCPDLEKPFEGWDILSPGDEIKNCVAFSHTYSSLTSSDEEGDSLASDIGLDHMMCQRLIGPNAVQDRDTTPSKMSLKKMDHLILCYTRESSREDTSLDHDLDLGLHVTSLSEKVEKISENSKRIWDAAIALRMKEQIMVSGGGGFDEGKKEEDEEEEKDVVDSSGDEREEYRHRSVGFNVTYYGEKEEEEDNDEMKERSFEDDNLCGCSSSEGEGGGRFPVFEDDKNKWLEVPETRDVGIDAMSGSQNSMSKSMERITINSGNTNSHHHQHQYPLSSSSLSRSLSSSSSSLSLSISHHPELETNVTVSQQPKSSTPELPDKEDELSNFHKNTTFVNNGNIVENNLANQQRMRSSVETDIKVEDNISAITTQNCHQHDHHQPQHDGILLNQTSNSNYMNIDKLTTYSDFVADLEMNAICQSNNQQHTPRDQRHQRLCSTCPPTLAAPPPRPPQASTNNSTTHTPVATQYYNNSSYTNASASSNTAYSEHNHDQQPQDYYYHHSHQQQQRRPHSTLPIHPPFPTSYHHQAQQHHNHRHSQHTPNRPHAPYVNQTIPRLQQSPISPPHSQAPQSSSSTTSPHRPQSYHSHTNLPIASSKTPTPLSTSLSPPPPPSPHPSHHTLPIHSSHAQSSSNDQPPPLPPRKPQVSRTLDGRPQVMIRPHRIQKNTSPSADRDRPHSFNHYLIEQSKSSRFGLAAESSSSNHQQRPRCSSVNIETTKITDNTDNANTSKSKISSKKGDNSYSKIPRRKLKTRRELAMRKKTVVECGGSSSAVGGGCSSRKSDGASSNRSWRDIDVKKGTPLTDSSGEDVSSN